jgi:nucleoside-diphosphate-sugar epimerase
MAMLVFVAGGAGIMGQRLVPQLVARGHQVTATTTSSGKLGLLERLGADAVVMDGLDAMSVGEAVAAARPDAIVHQMTALSAVHAGKPDVKHPDRFFATTIRLCSEGTITCWPPPRQPACPMSSRRALAPSTASARADG